MKTMKKIASILLALVMVMAMMSTAALAEPETGKITVENPIAGETYTVYRLFDLVSYDPAGNSGKGAYTYKVASEWETFFKYGGGKDYVTVDEQGYVTWNEGASAESLALAAMAHAATDGSGITSAGSQTAKGAEGETLVFSPLPLGYYLVDSSAGALCALDTTNSEATVVEKNEVPSMDKDIVENDGTLVKGTDVNVGDNVTFRLSAIMPNLTGYDEYYYTFVDTLSKGLSLNRDFKVTVYGIELGADEYSIAHEGAGMEEGETFQLTVDLVAFAEKHPAVPATLDDYVVVTYTAQLTSDALTTGVETNTAHLDYSDNPNNTESKKHTPDETVYVYDFEIVIDKYNGGDDTKAEKLAGATFVLRKSDGEGGYVYYKYADGKVTWVGVGETEPATVEAWNELVTSRTTNDQGAASFAGLDAGEYELVEIAAPRGYNMLNAPVSVTIKAKYNDKGEIIPGSDTNPDTNVSVGTAGGNYQLTESIANNTGAELPSTGGIGTTIFTVVGVALMVGAAILFIAKKRSTD